MFDAAKESRHILSLTDSFGESFKLLGITFDGKLSMAEAVDEVVAAAGWKLRRLLRTKRYYSDADLIVLFEAHMLSFLEYRTCAIYHATRTVLRKLDAVQTRFLRDAGVDEVTALMKFHLAPLSMRRDIAMLGMIHRAALGEGTPQLRKLFRRRPGSTMLVNTFDLPRSPPILRRSAWGLVPVYNGLGSGARTISTVKDFQAYLQNRVKRLIEKGNDDHWHSVYSPR